MSRRRKPNGVRSRTRNRPKNSRGEPASRAAARTGQPSNALTHTSSAPRAARLYARHASSGRIIQRRSHDRPLETRRAGQSDLSNESGSAFSTFEPGQGSVRNPLRPDGFARLEPGRDRLHQTQRLLDLVRHQSGWQVLFRESTMKMRLLGAAALVVACSLAHAAGFSLMSPEIKSGGTMPKSFEFNGFGCSGENKSPTLK